jgi:hypothetical protein
MSQNARCSKTVADILFPVRIFQVCWKTHGKTFSEFSDARQNIVGIVGSNDSLAPEKAAKLFQKIGKTFSESACFH